MTLRAWIIEMRGRVREALVPDLALLREELAQQRTRTNLMRIQMADQNLRISNLTREGDALRALLTTAGLVRAQEEHNKLRAENETMRAERERQQHISSPLRYTKGCPVCGAMLPAGYVCNRGDCPTRVTWGGAA
jgi:hypothetical protein